MRLRPARPEDEALIAALLDAAFGGPDEARLVERLRATGEAIAELVAEECGEIVGEAMVSRMARPEGWLALAPVAVAPERQRRGIGTELVRAMVSAARAGGWEAVVVVGDPDYYGRFGFSVAAAQGLSSPYPLDVTGLLLLGAAAPGKGTELVYPAAFAGL
jgi:putative acetyltransferase